MEVYCVKNMLHSLAWFCKSDLDVASQMGLIFQVSKWPNALKSCFEYLLCYIIRMWKTCILPRMCGGDVMYKEVQFKILHTQQPLPANDL
jgi:hypothetical protein